MTWLPYWAHSVRQSCCIRSLAHGVAEFPNLRIVFASVYVTLKQQRVTKDIDQTVNAVVLCTGVEIVKGGVDGRRDRGTGKIKQAHRQV